MHPQLDPFQTLMRQPLSWLHPQRFSLAGPFDSPALRAQINRLLYEQIRPLAPNGAHTDMARSWQQHWGILPRVAALIGARLAWPHLASGGRAVELSASQRAFAGYAAFSWLDEVKLDGSLLEEQLQALGLHALLAFREVVPEGLSQMLLLQFAVSAVKRQSDLSPIAPDKALFKLAIQHARFYPDTD
jgi:type III secretion system OrgA/MxiK family protein